MNLKKIFSSIFGFGTIGLLSSIFAKIQGMVFPASVQLFNQVKWTSSDIIQLIIKLVCVYFSCIVGGIVTAVFGGGTKEHYITAISIMLIVIWLWIRTIYPSWFWASLLIGILPFVLTGGYLKQIVTVKKEE
jgi:hypothetical protein